MRNWILKFQLAGFLIPISFVLLWPLLDKETSSIHVAIGNIQLLLWPSSIMMLGSAGNNGIAYLPLALSISVNVVLYGILGCLAWLGFKKNKWLLVTAGALLLFLWHTILSL